VLSGATNPTAAGATVIGVSVPDDLDLADTRYGDGPHAGAYLTDLEGQPADGVLTLGTPADGTVEMEDRGDGTWVSSEVAYSVGDTYTILRDGAEILRAEAAPPPTITLRRAHAAGEPLAIDLGGQDFDRVLVTVVDLTTGEERWDNAPADTEALLAALADTDALSVEIPGSALEEPGDLAIGVAGLRTNHPADVTDVNTLASMMATGVMSFQPVSVY
jgi:hypothetical protein